MFKALPRREAMLGVVLPLLAGICLVAAWQGVVTAWRVPAVILPAASDVLYELRAHGAELAYEGGFTGSESLLACTFAGLLGALAGGVLASSAVLRAMLYPNLVAFQLLPKIALAPLFVVWLGIDAPSRVTFAVFISFFPVALGTLTGLAMAPMGAVRLCRSLTASEWQIFCGVRVPYALPFFFSGMKVAATLSVVGVIVGEFISSQHGLGSAIMLAGSRADTPLVFAALVVLSAIGLALYAAIALAERLAARVWHA